MNELIKHLDEMEDVGKFPESDYEIQCKINEELGRTKSNSKKYS
tara:strand:+ start:459 stop:590 length:132 start_codon:yes stop_codon:yes gene_type:complete